MKYGSHIALVAMVALNASARDAQAHQQGSPPLTALVTRFASWTAVTGYERAVTDSLLTLFPDATRDRAGNVVMTLGRGTPKRLLSCPLDEMGWVVGNVTDDGYLTLRRVGRARSPLFDQQLEGHRVTLFGRRGPVPGVVGVHSTHLLRERTASDEPFSVDSAFVDVGATSRSEALDLGVEVLTPVALTKAPHPYGNGLLAAPVAGRRAACAALAAAVLAKPKVKGTVIAAFTVQSLVRPDVGISSLKNLMGPVDTAVVVSVPVKFAETAVETVAMADVDSVRTKLVAWMEGK
ncbi:MAG TPA: hypothetical protein VMH88_08510 [Gemmatimonadales bacterium]|nr:hypothetical protein [Gemmatimonadales bacterium]